MSRGGRALSFHIIAKLEKRLFSLAVQEILSCELFTVYDFCPKNNKAHCTHCIELSF